MDHKNNYIFKTLHNEILYGFIKQMTFFGVLQSKYIGTGNKKKLNNTKNMLFFEKNVAVENQMK